MLQYFNSSVYSLKTISMKAAGSSCRILWNARSVPGLPGRTIQNTWVVLYLTMETASVRVQEFNSSLSWSSDKGSLRNSREEQSCVFHQRQNLKLTFCQSGPEPFCCWPDCRSCGGSEKETWEHFKKSSPLEHRLNTAEEGNPQLSA